MTPGTRRSTVRSSAVVARSIRGITHPGVRWNTVTCAARGWISGTNWIDDAPVPTTATRSPLRS